MHVRILGPLEVVVVGRPVEVGGARQRALLARLALDAGRVVSEDSLARALWPGDGPADRTNALQTLVSRLRRALPGEQVLRRGQGGYRLDLPPEAVDALLFERLARDGRRALRDGDAAAAALRLREALALWRGEVLAEVADAPFAEPHRRRLVELRLSAVEERVEADLANGAECSELAPELRELTALHPLRERLCELLVRALHMAGRQTEALTAYAEYQRLLADELGTDPGSRLRDLHLSVLRDETPPRRRENGARPRGNLPSPLTSFVGRTEEGEHIRRSFGGGRLVTLVGPGGAGKTRLATTVAAELADRIEGGAWLVELAPVTDPAGLPEALAGALGQREPSLLDPPATAPDAVSRLAEALSGAETLIVLDNCEHLVEAAARLAADLLGRCPRLRMLVTSREPLRIGGEALCPVRPLGLPEAVRLFTDRAAAVRPGFSVTDDNAAAVGEICRRLDGLPLAIELAAARLSTLPVQALAERLDDRFRLLTGGDRTALPRHQTLRAVVSWSWELLTAEERRLARRLAVFASAITPEAAGRVCGLSPPAALDALSGLAGKSLLQPVDGTEARFRMLETIREYGLARLAESGEADEAEAAHTAYFVDLAEQAKPHLSGTGQLRWLDVLTAERDNLKSTFHRARVRGDAEAAVRLGAALALCWTINGNHAAVADRLRLALRSAEGAERPPANAMAVATAFYLFNLILSGGAAPAERQEIRDLAARGVRLAADHPATALVEGALALLTGEGPAGLVAIERQLPHADPWISGMLRLMRALLQHDRCDAAEVRRDLAAAVDDFTRAGERWGLAMSLTFLAQSLTTLGDLDGAVKSFEESIRLLRELDTTDEAGLQRILLAEARAQQGDLHQARAILLEAVTPGAKTPPPRYVVLALTHLGDVARWQGDQEEAARHYDAAREGSQSLPYPTPLVDAMIASAAGRHAVECGELETARCRLTKAFTFTVEAPDMTGVADVGVGVAMLCSRRGAATAAAEVLGAAHALRGGPSEHHPDIAGLTDRLKVELGEHAFQAAYARGSGSDRTGALALIEAQLLAEERTALTTQLDAR
ncbi:BTAD domain-containing putative transcriptional regulator [Actinomadura vinacea]|uniref:BTAD domain-containing putative transcriptional regulator n=1 Tax=Actinomadura vinacea TaxID=115336 RepID=A0ABN3IBP0_9ACTN